MNNFLLPPSSKSFVAFNVVSIPKTRPEALTHDGLQHAMEEEMLAVEHKPNIGSSLLIGKHAISSKQMCVVKINHME